MSTAVHERTGQYAALLFALLVARAPLSAQAVAPAQQTTSESAVVSVAKFLGGGAAGLAMHESGHLILDFALNAGPGVRGVSYGGIPFFAITHDPVTDGREFAISSAGFWVQHATSEWLLVRRHNLRDEHAPFAKGVLAFNVLTSVAYAGAAFARSGPAERDTRGMAITARVAEPWIGAVILAPAALDAARYFNPESRVLRWSSRAAKVGGAVLMVKALGH